MPTFRVFYLERKPKDSDNVRLDPRAAIGSRGEVFSETEWEETVEAPGASQALDAFFRDHAGAMDEVLIVEEDGKGHPIPGLDYDPDRTYVWVEEGSLMEYQGMTEGTAGAVTCPLCDGTGEVDEEIAAEFSEVWEEAEFEEYDEAAKGDIQG
ncbi:MAG: hypothetical protein WD904_13065 [Dehalococcoidia bacterium]